MERRFSRVWQDWSSRLHRGESLAPLLRAARKEELVEALARAGAEDPVAANAIATELLNRLRRAPYLGSFLVSAAGVVAIFVLDYVYTGTPLFLDSGERAVILVAASALTATASLGMYLLWRGALRALRARFPSKRAY